MQVYVDTKLDLVVAMICQRLIGLGSKLSASRRFGQTTLAAELALGEVKEAELMKAMDWLLGRQERIEKTLAKRHLAGEGFMPWRSAGISDPRLYFVLASKLVRLAKQLVRFRFLGTTPTR